MQGLRHFALALACSSLTLCVYHLACSRQAMPAAPERMNLRRKFGDLWVLNYPTWKCGFVITAKHRVTTTFRVNVVRRGEQMEGGTD